MSSQVEGERSARSGEGRSGYQRFWNRMIQSIRSGNFVMVSLFFIVGFLLLTYLGVLLDAPAVATFLNIPAAETLLKMPF
jgi:hypothetical protein